ncbi:DUF3099 domain-containing protein [Gordonia shandongensis]|uniref:DUF3099 domain-containing protein n=1 Tax=Gordonia shandongensis TaxID=376351 RepID=UPI00040B31AD|nr:DUF3099 domain-containing protein [Gordonia shandongensis]
MADRQRRDENHGADDQSFLITSAEPDLDAEFRARKRKYILLMSVRFPALILASLVYVWTQNGWYALAIILVSIPIPWIAVLKANDREPRKRGEVPTYHYGSHETVQPEIAAQPAPGDRYTDDAAHPVIDAAPDDQDDSSDGSSDGSGSDGSGSDGSGSDGGGGLPRGPRS